MQWFDHSSTASSDDAIMALRMEHPDSGAVDLYWAIVEKQYHDERSVPFSETDRETKSVLHRLLLGFDVAQKYVETMLEIDLLEKDACGKLFSARAKKTIDDYLVKAETARQNGKKGGRKPKRKPTEKPTDKPTPKPSEKPQNNTKQDSTGIGLDKLNQYRYASDGAAVAEATPPSAFQCPNCGVPMERTNSHRGDKVLHRCKLCAEEVWA